MKITPGVSVGPFAIGMEPTEYEAILGISQDVFKRTPEDPGYVIAYDERSLHLVVDSQRKIISISVFQPEKVELDGIQLLGRNLASVEADLRRSAFAISKAEVGLWIPKAGVLIVEIDGRVDCVEVLAAEP